MTEKTRWRLCAMMFLQYVIWGSWLPLLALYLSQFRRFSGTEIGWIFATQALASVTAVFVSGQIADRYISAERFLAVSHVVGGLAMFALALERAFWPFLITMQIYMLVYLPTLSLTNKVAFHHLKDTQREFGPVRLWGTIGWMAASWPFVFLLRGKEGMALESALTGIFVVAGAASIALAAFSFFLPPTPPERGGVAHRNAPLEAIRLLKNPTVLILFVVTFLDALVHQCYFQWTSPYLAAIGVPENLIMPAMSLGQLAEIATMAALGFVLTKLGWRKTMIIGILGHSLRFAIYASGAPAWMVVGSNVVHGLCYAFFFAAVYIFVDREFPKDVRASAQGLFNFLILGLGPFVGSLLWGRWGDACTTAAGIDFSRLFLAPTMLGLVAALVLFLGFRPDERTPAAREV
jgi:nucleoside transporter